ncbi:hypothetical protein [Turicimonas muris]|uniref:hypothetical protein n=1 Tax=Turicimonas muris TaxID=1796652 RepID=UPI00257334A2|nr:hypothetical protein [Turicimonas muris]
MCRAQSSAWSLMKGMFTAIGLLFLSYFFIYFSADIGTKTPGIAYHIPDSLSVVVDSVAEEQEISDIGVSPSTLKMISISSLKNEILRQDLQTKLTNTKIISATIEKIESKKSERKFSTVLEVSYRIEGENKKENIYKFTSYGCADNLLSGKKRRFFSSREKAFQNNVSKFHSFLVSLEGSKKSAI